MTAYDPGPDLTRFRRWRATHVLNLAAENEDRIHGTLLLEGMVYT
jgi:hypothetical protein